MKLKTTEFVPGTGAPPPPDSPAPAPPPPYIYTCSSTDVCDSNPFLYECICCAGQYKQSYQHLTNQEWEYFHDCIPCQTGTWMSQDVHRLSSCDACPPNSMSGQGSDSLSDCLCNAGTSGGVDGSGMYVPCQPCDAGTYKEITGSAPCQTCPPDSYSPSGSTRAGACQCNAGYTGTSTCEACATGTYK
jgi:hypothetical protein